MIIPTILEESLVGLKTKIEIFNNKVPFFHIDIGDGLFVKFKPEFTPEQAVELFPKFMFQIHLMCLNSADYITKKYSNIKTVIFQAETEENYLKTAEYFKRLGYEVGLCINLETPPPEYFENIDFIQFMAVVPGAQHNKFDEKVVQKIFTFHKQFPDVPIQVDGGVNNSNILDLKKAGAINFAVGSYILKSEKPLETYEELCGI